MYLAEYTAKAGGSWTELNEYELMEYIVLT